MTQGLCGYGPFGLAPKFAGADFANPPLVGTGPLTPLIALIALIQCPHPPQCFSGARGHGGNEKRSLSRCALATAFIYGICGCGPSGPAPKFAGAHSANPPLVGTGPLTPLKALIALIQCCHPPQCFSGARGHGGLSTAGTGNAHCCTMRLQQRLSTAFAATGHPALRPNSLARTSQMAGPLATMS